MHNQNNGVYLYQQTQTTMKTKEDFQNRLAELQNETKALLANSSKRVKATRIRLNEITTEFYKTKEQWRITLGTSL